MPDFSWRARLSAMFEEKGREFERTLGSAFLIGPRHLVTCAHTVETFGEDAWIRVLFPLAGRNGDQYARIVERAAWRDGEPDVAVLELPVDTGIPPAPLASVDALLPPDPTQTVGVSDGEGYDIEISALGFPTEAAEGASGDGRSSKALFDDAEGVVLKLLTTPDQQITQDSWQVGLPLSEPGTIRHGYSGGGAYLTRAWWPGWRTDYGRVVGMISTADERVEGRGGTLISLDAIGRVWEGIDDRIDLGWLTGAARRELRPIVTELTGALDFERVYRSSVPHFQHDLSADPPSSPWRWVRHTAEKGTSADRGADLRVFLRRVHDSLPHSLRSALRHWLERHHHESFDEPDIPSYVTVSAHKLLHDDTYTVTLTREDDGMPSGSMKMTEVSESDVQQSVQRHLNEFLITSGSGGGYTVFEFVVPVQLLHGGFELWHLTKDIQIIDRYPVVLSSAELHTTLFQGAGVLAEGPDQDRAGTAFHRNEAVRQRWNRLQKQGRASAEVFNCTRSGDRAQTKRKLNAGSTNALVHSTRIQFSQVEGALDAGVPIMLLPRTACDQETHQDCSGKRRGDELKRLAEDTDFEELADRVHGLRQEALGDENKGHCGHELSLVVNNPERIGNNTEPPMYMGSEDPV